MSFTETSEINEDTRPYLLYTKFQRLKNSATKLARVLIVDENPAGGVNNVGNGIGQKTKDTTVAASQTN